MVNLDKTQLSQYYGENWDHIESLLVGLTQAGFWEFLRGANLQPVIEGMRTDESAEDLAKSIIERRVENRVLLTLEHAFAP